jgi:glycosyltransferase involved in cell wall biosynthesis
LLESFFALTSSRVERVRLTLVVDSDVFGGAEAYVAHLLRRLPERFDRTLLAADGLPDRLREVAEATSAEIVGFQRPRGKVDVSRLGMIARALRSTRPSLVHVNMATAANNRHVIGLCAVLRLRAVATLHIVAPLTSPSQTAILRRAYRRLAGLIAVSEETRRQLCDDLELPREAVRVIANGVDERPAVVPPADGRFRVGALGRLTPQKGFDLLIEAVRRLTADGVQLEAVVAGDGPERAALAEAADGLPVELRSFVSDVPAFHAELGAFCLPSRWEGLPFALLEAMMSGLPCVASDVGDVGVALREVGLLVPPEDPVALAAALQELAASADRRRELGAAAHARARERYTAAAMVAETVRAYDAALAR